MKSSLVILLLLLGLTFTYAMPGDTVTVIGVGDIMMGTLYPEAELPTDSGAHLMEEVDSILQSADVTMGNLEGVLLNKGGTAKTCKDSTVCYVFRSPEGYVKNLVKAGFDVMSIANNHAGDFGDLGRQSTMRALDGAGLLYAGQLPNPSIVFIKDSITYGFAAFSPNSNCVSVNDTAAAAAIIRALDSVADIVIVSFHGGAEGNTFQRVPKKHEMFHGEDRGDVHAFAHTLVDAGADIIIGSGPHVSRAVELYNNRFIAYSAGNFCTYGGINVRGVNGLAPIFKVSTNRKGEFIKAHIFPTYQLSHTYVHLDKSAQVTKVIRDLTKQDFPDTKLTIDLSGEILPLTE